MNILGWILFGFVVGLIARALMPGRDPMGLVGTTVLGIIGALVSGLFGQAVGWYGPQDGAGFLSATIGAVLMLFIYHQVRSARLRRSSSMMSDKSRDKDFPRRAA